MAITLLYGCCQIETSTPDLEATRRFMIDVLGAGPIEQALAREIAALIPGVGYDVDHLDCGEAVFQINQPSPTMRYNGRKSIHQAYLDSVGPSVTNLNFFIDDYRHARDVLTAMGAETHIEGPSSAARALADYGSDNCRPGADERPFLFMGARHLIGLDLEIMEPNFRHFAAQTVQYPAFVQPRPQTGDGNLHLERLIILVPDLQQTYNNLERLFSPASRTRPYEVRHGGLGKSFRVTLGGIEIEYCQPLSAHGELAEGLTAFGPGVIAIEFGAHDIARIVDGCVSADVAVEDNVDLLGDKVSAEYHRIRCRALTGFDIVVRPRNPISF